MKDIITKQGFLTYIGEAESRRNKSGHLEKFMKVKCDCGTEKEVNKSSFRRGRLKYCSKECPKKYEKYTNEIGNTYGNYTILNFVGMNKKGNAVMCARCICGTEKEIEFSRLASGRVMSCASCSNRKVVPVGTRFGLLTVQEVYACEKGNTKVVCSCDCGNVKDAYLSSIKKKEKKDGYIISCGCANKKNLVGKTFGLLVVVSETEKVEKIYNGNKVYRRRWICNCVCGSKGKIVMQSELESGDTKSCGCLISTENRRKRVLGEKNPMYGKIGEDNPKWDPERTREQRQKERKGHQNFNWRRAVFDRDGYHCKCCGQKSSGNIVAHHIFNYKDFPARRFDVENGITLCTSCHNTFHSIYGKVKNTNTQLEEYMNTYFMREAYVSVENLLQTDVVYEIYAERVKPYKVTFPNGEVERYFTYDEMNEKCGISRCAALNSVKREKPISVRQIFVKKEGEFERTFDSYSEAGRYFGCSHQVIKKCVLDQMYHCEKYPALSEYEFEEKVSYIIVERTN